MRRYSPYKSEIPRYFLYGEQGSLPDSDFVHIEDIADRSSVNGWVIRPHRHNKLFQLLCMYDGELQIQLDGSQHDLEGSCVIAIPPGVVHGFQFHPRTRGVVLSLAVPILENPLLTGLLPEKLLSAANIISLEDGSDDYSRLQAYLKDIRKELDQSAQWQQQSLEALLRLVFLQLLRAWQVNVLLPGAGNHTSRLLQKFRLLLDGHFLQHWTVADYANALHTSISTLNRACKDFYGLSCKQIIDERVMNEARRKVRYTQEKLDQIAYGLGYKDPAYFSRVFKKFTGVSPRLYRQSGDI